MVVEVEDRVADELAGPVVGRLAPAIGLDHLDVDAFGYVELRGLVRPATERDDRLVLEQDHRVRLGSGLHLFGELALQRERLTVRRQAFQVEEDRGSHYPAG